MDRGRGRERGFGRRGALAALLVAAALAGAGCTGPAERGRPVDGRPAAGSDGTVALRIVAFNDLHGQLEPGPTLRLRDPARPTASFEVGAGGVAPLATLVSRLRDGAPNTVVVSSGDLVGASPLASALFRDEPSIEAANLIGVDVAIPGNHEFDRGLAELKRLIGGGCHAGDGGPAASCAGRDGPFRGARFPIVAANLHDADGRPVFPASVVREVDGVPVAFVGAVLRGTPTVVSPEGVRGLRFGDEADAINREVTRLRAERGVEAFVAVIHEGGETDGDWNDPACPGARGPVFGIVDRLRPEVDVVLTAHTHRGYACLRDAPGNPRLPVLQATANGRGVSVADLVLDRATRDVVRARTAVRNLPVANGVGGDRAADGAYPPIAPDPAVQALVDHYVARARPLAERPVGRLTAAATRAPSAGGDSALGRLVADAQLAATRAADRGGAVVAFTNPGGLRADLACTSGPAPCPVRFGDVFAAQPFGNSLVSMTLTGAQLLAALEQQFAGVNAARPRVLQPSAGFAFSWRAQGSSGPRIVEARLHGAPIDPAGRYRVTVNSFLAEGGDGFDAFRGGVDRLGGVLDVEALVDALRAVPEVTPPAAARVQAR